MRVQLRRGHAGPCPLPTAGGSFGAYATGNIDDEFSCYCGRVWQIVEYCTYCEDIRIGHTLHTLHKHWVLVEDSVWINRLVLIYIACAFFAGGLLVLHWPL